jgi:MATE family multidrug resistance protein
MLGPVSLAAQSCLLSTTSTFFQVPASLGIASAVRTGNLLGAGRGWEAKWASRTSLIMSIFFSACNRSVGGHALRGLELMYSVICMAFKKNWGYLFNNDPEVVAIVASIMPYIALFQVSLQTHLSDMGD